MPATSSSACALRGTRHANSRVRVCCAGVVPCQQPPRPRCLLRVCCAGAGSTSTMRSSVPDPPRPSSSLTPPSRWGTRPCQQPHSSSALGHSPSAEGMLRRGSAMPKAATSALSAEGMLRRGGINVNDALKCTRSATSEQQPHSSSALGHSPVPATSSSSSALNPKLGIQMPVIGGHSYRTGHPSGGARLRRWDTPMVTIASWKPMTSFMEGVVACGARCAPTVSCAMLIARRRGK